MTDLAKRQHARRQRKLFSGMLFFCFCWMGCSPSMEKIEQLGYSSEPSQVIRDAEIYYSRNGIIEVKIQGETVNVYEEKEDPRMVFSDGINCQFLNRDQSIKSTLTAEFAIRHNAKQLMEARNNVVIIDYANEDTVYCEQVFWDQYRRIIYSEKQVKRVQPSGVSFGDGFEANENFDSLRIKNLKGEIEYSESDH